MTNEVRCNVVLQAAQTEGFSSALPKLIGPLQPDWRTRLWQTHSSWQACSPLANEWGGGGGGGEGSQ